MDWLFPVAGLAIYIVGTRWVVSQMSGSWRSMVFAGLNLAFLYGCFFSGRYWSFVAYFALVAFQYLTLRLFAEREGWKPWIAFFTPIFALILVRYVPLAVKSGLLGSIFPGQRNLNFALIGISYLAFRSSYLVLEVRNKVVPMPDFFSYLGFCFFLPTMPVGPIDHYSNFSRAFDVSPPIIPSGRAAMRIVTGLVKYQFLGNICNQLSYSGLLMDDHYHGWFDLAVAVVFYYLYLYCNFSGFCDAAIGVAGLIGIPVAENFNNPFAARNMKEFWNRWHITLSHYMRDVVFFPLSKFLTRLLGPSNINHAVAISVAVVFLLIGIWHGVGWNYAAFGAVHAIGVVGVHYYTIALKKWLSRDGFRAYNASRWIHLAAVAITFCYAALALFLFANNSSDMRQILSALKGGVKHLL